MKDLEKIVSVDGYQWKVIFTPDDQIMFAFKVPKELSTWKNDKLWFSFDPEDDYNQDEWSSTHKEMPTDFSIFKVVSAIFDAIAELVNRYKIQFFYFQANTEKKGKVYHLLSERLVSKLGGEWMYQAIDEEWFYLTKEISPN